MSENESNPNGMSDEDFLGLVLRHLDDSLDDAGTAALHAEMLRDVRRRRQFVSLHLRSVKLSELLGPQLFDDPDGSAPAALDDAQILPALDGIDSQTEAARSTADQEDPFTTPSLRYPEGSDSLALDPTLRRTSESAWWKSALHSWSSATWRTRARGWATAASLVIVSAISLVVILHHLAPHPEPLAMATTLDAVWAGPNSVAAAGTLIKTGVPQSLKAGYAELTSSNGLVVIVQGPATFTVEKPGVVSLTSGRLTASVPKPERGFTVNTPIAHVVDLGTEFGVSVVSPGETDVQTFSGTVSLTSATSPTSAPASLLTAGGARQVIASGDIAEVSANTTRFVRPQQFDDWKANGTPYQHWKAYSERLRSDPDLVAYYTFDKSEAAPDRLLNRVSTTGAALDGELGLGRLHECARWTDGRWPQKGALAFARDSHEYVAMKAPAGSVLDFSRGEKTAAPFTICAWFRVEDPHPQRSSLFLRGLPWTARSQQFQAEIYPDSSIRASVGDLVATGPQARANGQWQQIAFVYDPDHSALELYLDGNLVAQRNDAPRQLRATNLPIGLGCRNGPDYLPPLGGRIDEFAVFRRALSAERVREMYDAEKPE